MDKYTSLKLSKLLAENECKLEGVTYWVGIKDSKNINFKGKSRAWVLVNSLDNAENYKFSYEDIKIISAYDILNDICVKYAKEFFGEGKDSGHKLIMKIGEYKYNDTNWTTTNYYTINILILLQQNKKQEAEDYIWKHCKFNPNNK